MTLIKDIKQDEFLNSLIINGEHSSHSISKLSKANRNSLRDLIKYFAILKKNNLINEKQHKKLISIALANYIENEVENRIWKSLNEKVLFFFEKSLSR